MDFPFKESKRFSKTSSSYMKKLLGILKKSKSQREEILEEQKHRVMGAKVMYRISDPLDANDSDFSLNMMLKDLFDFTDVLGENFYIESFELFKFFYETKVRKPGIILNNLLKGKIKHYTNIGDFLDNNDRAFYGNIHIPYTGYSISFYITKTEWLETDETPQKLNGFTHTEVLRNALKDKNYLNNILEDFNKDIKGKTEASYVVDILFDENKNGGFRLIIPENINHDTSETINESEDYQEGMMRCVLNMLAYIQAFPEKVTERAPLVVSGEFRGNGKKNYSIGVHEDIIDRSGVRPHFRSGHFRMLSSDKFVNKKGQVVFVRSSFVHGRAKTVHEETPDENAPLPVFDDYQGQA